VATTCTYAAEAHPSQLIQDISLARCQVKASLGAAVVQLISNQHATLLQDKLVHSVWLDIQEQAKEAPGCGDQMYTYWEHCIAVKLKDTAGSHRQADKRQVHLPETFKLGPLQRL
jgi:hypothetical protein